MRLLTAALLIAATNAAAQPIRLRTGADLRKEAAAEKRSAAPARVVPTLRFDGQPMDEWMKLALDDSTLLKRDRAISALRRAPVAVRAEAARRFAGALKDAAPARRLRAIQALGQLAAETQGQVGWFDGPEDLTPALPAIAEATRDKDDLVRGSALWLLTVTGSRAPAVARPAAREALRDPTAMIREAGAAALGVLGDTSDAKRVSALLGDPSPAVRAAATTSLGKLGRRGAVLEIARMLADSSALVRAMAARALGDIGPAAKPVVPQVTELVDDTTQWRTGSYAVTVGEEAAWTLTRILPRRGVGLIPARVDVSDANSSLRSDGLGTYVMGADSVKAFVSAALNLDLAGPRGDGRTTRVGVVRPLRRSLTFDLSQPVTSSGARPIKPVKDNEAVIHIFWSRDQERKVLGMTRLDPSEALIDCQRAEFQFRINGEPHVLQMGEWSEGEINERAPKLHGRGTTSPQVSHRSVDEWVVLSPTTSVGRLWNVSDPSHPVDRGLYYFQFAITWSALTTR